jgi:hypothetical protein
MVIIISSILLIEYFQYFILIDLFGGGVIFDHFKVELDESMEDDLLVRQFGDLFDEEEQKVL